MATYVYYITLNKKELKIYKRDGAYYYYTNLSEKILITKKTLRHYLINSKKFRVKREFEIISCNGKLLASKTTVVKTYQNGLKIDFYIRKVPLGEKLVKINA